ncbi:sialic acid-binding Ig-like lectin 13 isoform X2 [Cetorhinus maximus]
MIGKSYFLLSLLQVGLSQEWKGDTPREVTAQEGSCVQIPCHYSYPSHLESRPGAGVWFNNENQIPEAPIAFHSKDHSHEIPRFRHRTRLSGDLKDGDCSLIINNISREDAGPYFFRIEFDSRNSYNYYPLTQLHVSDFTDKPTIFPAEIIAGKRVDVRCTFNTTCNGTAAPVLTWDTPTDVPGPVSNTVTQHGVTLTYTSVLTLIASVKHHGHTLSCRVRYPSVSSERTLVLTVQYTPQNLSITSLDMINVSSINIIEGNSAVIICSVESFPASNLMWRHLNVPMNRTSSNNELWLVILHVTSRDTGDYQCVAENEHGAVEGFITITVEWRDSNVWKAGLLAAGICLSVGLSGFFIFKCVRKGSSTGRGHSAQAERVGSSSTGEQSDRSWREQHRKRSFSPSRACGQFLPRRAVGQVLELQREKLMKYLGVDNKREILLPPLTSPSWTVTRVERRQSTRGDSAARFVCTDSMSLQLPIRFGKETTCRNLDYEKVYMEYIAKMVYSFSLQGSKSRITKVPPWDPAVWRPERWRLFPDYKQPQTGRCRTLLFQDRI